MIWKNNMKYLIFVLVAVCVSCACEPERKLPAAEGVRFARYAEDVSVSSKCLGKTVGFNILLPSDYLTSKDKRYPVVYMLHGFGDNRKSWNDQYLRVESKIEELEGNGLQSMIYVFPDGYNSYYSNTYDGSFKYMDMFIDELVPYIDKVYRTIPDRQHRAVVGYSMGGFGAMVLPMKNPDVFGISVPLSMSFRTDEQYMTEGPQSGWDGQWGRIFGGIGLSGKDRLTDYYKSHCPFYQYVPENFETLSEVNLFLHCGDDEEQLLIANDDLHVQLRDYGYEHEYRVADGGHTSIYWRNSLDEVLPYIQFVMEGGKDWNDDVAQGTMPDVSLNDDGMYVSDSAVSEVPTNVNVIYFAYRGLDRKDAVNIVSIIAGTGGKTDSFAVVPCDLTVRNIVEWVDYIETSYGFGTDVSKRSVVAVEDSGEEVYEKQAMFSSLFFDNASLPLDRIEVFSDKFYYIGQTDDGACYKGSGLLYKACKSSSADFQYRVRNGSGERMADMYSGVREMTSFINY